MLKVKGSLQVPSGAGWATIPLSPPRFNRYRDCITEGLPLPSRGDRKLDSNLVLLTANHMQLSLHPRAVSIYHTHTADKIYIYHWDSWGSGHQDCYIPISVETYGESTTELPQQWMAHLADTRESSCTLAPDWAHQLSRQAPSLNTAHAWAPFTDGETEAQGSRVTCPSWHSP